VSHAKTAARAVLSGLIFAAATAAVTHARQTKPVDAPVAIEQLRVMFDDGQYQDVLKQIAKVMSLRRGGGSGVVVGASDRHEIFALKAESHLRLGQNDSAIDAFGDAAEAAPDEHVASIDRATVILLQKSKRSAYAPRQPGPDPESKPIDIVNKESRRRAFRALFNDERAEAQPTIEAARNAERLAPLLEAAAQVARLRQIELAAGGDGESAKLMSPLSKRARSLMCDETKSIEKRVDQIEKSANKKKKMGSTSVYRKQGLGRDDPKELKEQMQTASRIAEAAEQLGRTIADDQEDFDQIRTDARHAAEHAQRVLTADYTGNFDRS
jgi:hypothetical protein